MIGRLQVLSGDTRICDGYGPPEVEDGRAIRFQGIKVNGCSLRLLQESFGEEVWSAEDQGCL